MADFSNISCSENRAKKNTIEEAFQMKTTKKLIAITLAAMILLSTAACGGSKPAEAAPAPSAPAPIATDNAGEVGEASKEVEYEKTVYIGYHFDLDTADPYGSATSAQRFYSNYTFDTVVYNNPDTGEVEPRLATEWKDVNGDGKVWEFKLREGVKFHNGNDFVADDVKFTWEYTASGAGNVARSNPSSSYVESMDVVDDHTIRFNLNAQLFDWPSYMDTKIYSKKAFDELPVQEAGVIGTGPYYYDKAQQISGVEFVAQRFDDYWAGIDNYPTEKIVFKVLLDEDTRVAAIQAGDLDMIFNVSASYYDTLNSDSNLKMLSRAGANSYYMGFNYRKQATNDLRVRKALTMGINRDDIAEISFNGGIGGSGNYNFCVETGIGYAEVDAYQYNPEEAKALLKEAGYENLKLTLGHTSSTKAIAEVVQANLMMIGVTVELRQVDATNWTAFKKGDEYDIVTDYAAYTGALLYNFNRFFDPNGSANMYGYNSEEYKALELEVLNAGSFEGMVEKFADLQQFVAEDLPVIPLAVNTQVAAVKKDVEGVTLHPTSDFMNFSTIRIPARG